MLVTVIHDANGRIGSVIVGSPGAGPAGSATMEPGERRTELEVAEITPGLDDQKMAERMGELIEHHMVDVQAAVPTLLKQTFQPTKK